jgi:hypothetical protein
MDNALRSRREMRRMRCQGITSLTCACRSNRARKTKRTEAHPAAQQKVAAGERRRKVVRLAHHQYLRPANARFHGEKLRGEDGWQLSRHGCSTS